MRSAGATRPGPAGRAWASRASALVSATSASSASSGARGNRRLRTSPAPMNPPNSTGQVEGPIATSSRPPSLIAISSTSGR